jgi:hypothetical protein
MTESQSLRLTPSISFSAWLAKRLSRVTSSGELIPEIDGLRFLAIASVLLHHTMSIYLRESGRSAVEVQSQSVWAAASSQSWWVPLAYSGHFGVNLFFAISGFILALPFAKRSFDAKFEELLFAPPHAHRTALCDLFGDFLFLSMAGAPLRSG